MFKRIIFNLINRTLAVMGLHARLLNIPKTCADDVPHTLLAASASYAPWLNDQEFLRAYQKIKSFTLVDIYRCWELWSLIGQLTHLPGDVLEIGVWRGGTACLIASKMLHSQMSCTCYLADTFTGVVKASTQDTRYQNGEHSDTSVSLVIRLIESMNLQKNTKIIEGIFPDESASSLTTDEFKFCHIDVDTYASTKGCFEWIWPRLIVGGIVVFDDFGFQGCEGCTRFVNTLQMENMRMIYNLNGHAVIIKVSLPISSK